MAPSIQYGEPTTIAAGETTQWSLAPSIYPPTDGWTLKYSLRGARNNVVITAVARDVDYLVTIAANDSRELTPGAYEFTGYVERTVGDSPTERFRVSSGAITVLNDFLATTGDFRSHVVKVIESLEALIEGRLTADIEEYQIGGKSVKNIPICDATQLLAIYKSKLYQQQHPGKLGPAVAVRFVRP